MLTDVGYYSSYAGKAEEGLVAAQKGMRLNPHYPDYYLVQLGQICFDGRQYEDAVAAFERSRSVQTTLSSLYLAASHAALGDAAKAKDAVRRALELDPRATLKKWTHVKMAPYGDPEYLQHYRENLRKAGMPD